MIKLLEGWYGLLDCFAATSGNIADTYLGHVTRMTRDRRRPVLFARIHARVVTEQRKSEKEASMQSSSLNSSPNPEI